MSRATTSSPRRLFWVLVLAPVLVVATGALVLLLQPGTPQLQRSHGLVGLAILAVFLTVVGLGTFIALARARAVQLDRERTALARLADAVAPVLLPGGSASLTFLFDYACLARPQSASASLITAVALSLLFAFGGVARLVSRAK